jgi:uncharacterized membrane protein
VLKKIPHILLILVGSAVAWASESAGSNARLLIPALAALLVAIIAFRPKPFPIAASWPWGVLAATFFIPFLPGVLGPYPPTRFLLVIAAAFILARGIRWEPDRFRISHLFFLLLWLTLLGARAYELHKRLAYGYDLAHVLNILSNTLEGRFLWSDYTDASILSHHFFLSLALLAPLHGLWRSPFLLQGLQIVLMGASVIMVQQAAWRRFGRGASAATFFTFLLHPAFQGQALHEFDPGVIGLCGVAIALLGYAIPHRPTLLGGALLAILSKEHFILAAAVGGFLLLFEKKHRADGKLLIGGAAVALVLFLGGTLFFSGPFDLAAQIRLRLTAGAADAPPLLSVGKIGYLLHMLLPNGGMALIAWPLLLPALPEILINLVSRFPMYHLAGHYSVVTLPFLAFATGAAIAKIETRYGGKNSRRAAAYVVASSILAAVFSNLGPISHTLAFYDVVLSERPDEPRFLDSLVARLPSGTVAVRGNHRLLVYFGARRPATDLSYMETDSMMASRDLLIGDHAPPPDPNLWERIDSHGEVVVFARRRSP